MVVVEVDGHDFRLLAPESGAAGSFRLGNTILSSYSFGNVNGSADALHLKTALACTTGLDSMFRLRIHGYQFRSGS